MLLPIVDQCAGLVRRRNIGQANTLESKTKVACYSLIRNETLCDGWANGRKSTAPYPGAVVSLLSRLEVFPCLVAILSNLKPAKEVRHPANKTPSGEPKSVIEIQILNPIVITTKRVQNSLVVKRLLADSCASHVQDQGPYIATKGDKISTIPAKANTSHFRPTIQKAQAIPSEIINVLSSTNLKSLCLQRTWSSTPLEAGGGCEFIDDCSPSIDSYWHLDR